MPNEKFILDATAGFRMMWFDKKHPNCIYLDNREECKPDIVGDFRDLQQFPDETFRLIVFDPPHELSDHIKNFGFELNTHYGWLEPETWQSDLRKGLKECWRVLQQYGVLIFKWNTKRIKAEQLFPLFPEKPLFSQFSKKLRSESYWFCFMKIPKEQQP